MPTVPLAARLLAALVIATPLLGREPALARPGHAAPARGGHLTVAYSINAVTFDPAQSVNPPDNGITTGALFDGLYRINLKGALVPDLADGPPQVEKAQTVFTVHLRHGVYFNALGFAPRELTAQDVVYTYNRVLDPHLKPTTSWGQAGDTVIAGADAYIARQGDERLRHPGPGPLHGPLHPRPLAFLLRLCDGYLRQLHRAPRGGAEVRRGLRHPSRGHRPLPAQAVDQDPEPRSGPQPPLLRPRPALPGWDQLPVQRGQGPAGLALEGRPDRRDRRLKRSAAPTRRRRSAADPQYAAYVQPAQPSPTSNTLFINNLIPPFDNKLVREAVAYAINKRRILVRYRGQAAPSTQIYPPAVPQHEAGFQRYPYDPAKAGALLKQAGYTGTPVEVLVDQGSSNDPLEAPSVEQDLRAAGFTVKERAVSDSQWNTLAFQNKAYTIMFSYWSMDYPDAYDFVVPTYTKDGFDGGLNFSRYLNPAVDSLVAKAEALPFGGARDALYRQIQRTLVDDVATVPLFYRNRFNLGGPHVGSLGWSPAYSYNEWAYAWRR